MDDQLIYHRLRGIELDIHTAKRTDDAPPGDWFVYHSPKACLPHTEICIPGETFQTTCTKLSDCLEEIRGFHLASPNHEVVTIMIDTKSPFDSVSSHGRDDLESLIARYIDPTSIWRPADLLQGCPGTSTLQAAIETCGWPFLSTLRGKVILTVSGDYAGDYLGNDPAVPAAARMGFILTGIPDSGDITANASQIFFQPGPDQEGRLPDIGRAGFVTRFDANSQKEWWGVASLGVNLIATNAISVDDSAWATTVNGNGWPFQALCGATPDVTEDARAITVKVKSGDISQGSDDFVFLRRDEVGPTTSWRAGVSTADGGSAKGCLMARADDSADAPFIAVCRPSDGGRVLVRSRFARGDGTSDDKNSDFPPGDTVSSDSPIFLKLDIHPASDGAACGGQPGPCTCATALGSVDGDASGWASINPDGDVCVRGDLAVQGLAASSNGDAHKIVFTDVRVSDGAGTTMIDRSALTPLPIGDDAELIHARDGFEADKAPYVQAVTCETTRADDKTKPIYFIHGHEGSARADCHQWDTMIRTFTALGHTGPQYRVGYYHDDVDCDVRVDDHGDHAVHHSDGHIGGSHTADAPIEHLAYHLAWLIYDQFSRYGQPVDVVAHSMGGLMIRYALAQSQRHDPDFPPYLLVEDVVTMGTPHGGARYAGLCRGSLLPGACTPQAREMRAGSPFLKWLEANAWAPEGLGGTDWTTMGSDSDGTVAAERAAATSRRRNQVDKYMHSSHKVWYTRVDGITHDDFRNDARDSRTADMYISNGGAPLVHIFDGEHPVFRAELAVSSGAY